MTAAEHASVEFTDPPAPRAGRNARVLTPEVAAALQSRPGEWAKVGEAWPRNRYSSVRKYCKQHPQFEATSRTVEPGQDVVAIYVRFIGVLSEGVTP